MEVIWFYWSYELISPYYNLYGHFIYVYVILFQKRVSKFGFLRRYKGDDRPKSGDSEFFRSSLIISLIRKARVFDF